MNKSRKLTPINNILGYIILIIASLIVIIPILWMISTSFKPDTEVTSLPIRWIPKNISFNSYLRMWTDSPFGDYFKNSIIVTLSATIIAVFFSALAGYGISRFSFKTKGLFLTFLLVTQMIPAIVLLIPYFKLLTKFGLIDSLLGLIVIYISFTIPFCTWMLRGYFDAIPKDLDDAAAIDGCGNFRIFSQIILPLAVPGIIATALYSIIICWNEYLYAFVIITKEDLKTIPVGIAQSVQDYAIYWNDMMAKSIIASIPVIIIFVLMQKYFINSLSAGAVKQ